MLIQCKECAHVVSSSAAMCVKCGAPTSIENRDAGTTLHTTQLTAKKYKLHLIFSIMAIFVGLLCMYATRLEPEPNRMGWAIFLSGTTWYFCTKANIWWHHK